jgi:mRNA interferase MazF
VTMKRGEVWWANLPLPAGKRPVLLLSRNAAYAVRSLITIAPITRTARGIPAEVSLGPADGLPRPCEVNCDSIATIPKALLVERISALGPTKLTAVTTAIRFALSLS